jgi:subfamily B ATP-binding cassette protein MsbA
MVITTFFFKNLFNYLASHHIMHLKWRFEFETDRCMIKLSSCPFPTIQEKRKGDMMARMLGDVNEVKTLFLF